MRTDRRNRVDELLELIDRCLDECDAAPATDPSIPASHGGRTASPSAAA